MAKTNTNKWLVPISAYLEQPIKSAEMIGALSKAYPLMTPSQQKFANSLTSYALHEGSLTVKQLEAANKLLSSLKSDAEGAGDGFKPLSPVKKPKKKSLAKEKSPHKGWTASSHASSLTPPSGPIKMFIEDVNHPGSTLQVALYSSKHSPSEEKDWYLASDEKASLSFFVSAFNCKPMPEGTSLPSPPPSPKSKSVGEKSVSVKVELSSEKKPKASPWDGVDEYLF